MWEKRVPRTQASSRAEDPTARPHGYGYKQFVQILGQALSCGFEDECLTTDRERMSSFACDDDAFGVVDPGFCVRCGRAPDT